MTDTDDDSMGYAHVDDSTSVEEMVSKEQSEVNGEFESAQVIGDTSSIGFSPVDKIIGNRAIR